jgi:tripartite-type tricarboxylate transporter receptor subunit TctC
VVNNIKGGSGATGMKNVMEAKPDGYTVLFFHTEALLPKVTGMINYDIFNFKLCGNMLADNTTVLATHKGSGFKTIQEFVDKCKKNPGQPTFGMATGGYPHLIGVSLGKVANINMNLVDIGGNAAKTTALLGHKVDLINTQYGLVKDYFANGEFICLGILSKDRNPLIPNIPTLKEQGYDLEFNKVFFTAMPKDTPDSVRDTFSAALERTCKNQAYIDEMKKYFIQVKYTNPADALTYWQGISKMFAQYAPAMKASIK